MVLGVRLRRPSRATADWHWKVLTCLTGVLTLIRGANGKKTKTTEENDEIPTLAWLALGLLVGCAAFGGYRLAGLVRRFTPRVTTPQKEKDTQTDLKGIALNDLTIEAIKLRLACHGLSGAGSKPALIARLLPYEPWWRVV